MKVILLAVSVALFSSCSRINVESQERYRQKNNEFKNLRHGIVPRSTVMVTRPDEASVSRGKTLYDNHCISCHGPKGEGNGPLASQQKIAPSNLRQLVTEVPDFDLFVSFSNWKGDMPGWKEKFTQGELEDIKSYLKTL